MRSLDRKDALERLKNQTEKWARKEKKEAEDKATFLKMILKESGADQVLSGNIDKVASAFERSLSDLGVGVK